MKEKKHHGQNRNQEEKKEKKPRTARDSQAVKPVRRLISVAVSHEKPSHEHLFLVASLLVPIHAGVENRRERRRKAAATQSVQAAPTPCSPTQAGIPKGRDAATSPVPSTPRRRIHQAVAPPFAEKPSHARKAHGVSTRNQLFSAIDPPSKPHHPSSVLQGNKKGEKTENEKKNK